MYDSRHHFRLKGAAAEAVVHELAAGSFFTDWCYPNPKRPDGKELCDLLVVFDRVAIICQIKDLKLHTNGQYNPKAVEKNVRQLGGAYRRVMDANRPITLVNPRRGEEVFDPAQVDEVFLVSVLSGDGEDFFSMAEAVKDKWAHMFTGAFLEIALRELDTIDDFVAYLREKERFFDRIDDLVVNGGEEELLAVYLMDNRSFARFDDENMAIIEEGHWAELQERVEYRARNCENEISYGWDRMIDRAHESSDAHYERVARELARPNRFARRWLAKAFFEAHVKAHESTKSGVWRRVVAHDGVTYCFLFMDNTVPRETRRGALGEFCFVARGKIPENPVVIGIATERHRRTGSYDFCYRELPDWTENMARQAAEIQARTGLLTSTTAKQAHEDEYPA